MKRIFLLSFLLCAAITVRAQVADDFESGELAEWTQLPAGRWAATSVTPLSGSRSLQHIFDNTGAAADIIYRPLTGVDPSGGRLQWRFVLRHGNDPSAANRWAAMLYADAAGSEWIPGGHYTGYAVGVNMKGADDTLTLYAVRNHAFDIIGKTAVNWQRDVTPNGKMAVEITRTGEGVWQIRGHAAGDTAAMRSIAAPVVHADYAAADYFGFLYQYTATADRKWWMDDVQVVFTPVEGPVPPPVARPACGDVVISEIMAAPAPAVGLPEVQYIELYNRLEVPVTLRGWKLEYTTAGTGNTTVGSIGEATVPAHGYLILCTSAARDIMETYGTVASVSYIGSLSRSGKTLSLKDAEGTLLARVAYSDRWIADETKRTGGWSLEKIDLDNLSETATNWGVSTAEQGGTPGAPNAIRASNPDTEPPAATACRLIDAHTLQLTFGELFDTTRAKNPQCYVLSNGVGHPDAAVWNAASPEQITLHFAKPFAQGVLYTLTVAAPFCDLAGNAPPSSRQVFGNLFAPQPGHVVINEVLFNPHPDGADFVEIYNRSDRVFDLQQLSLAHRDKNGEVASVHALPSSCFLHPGDYAVFSTGTDYLRRFYTVPSPEKIMVLGSLPSYPNEAGCVVLLAKDDTVIDELLYTEAMHSGFIDRPRGVSLERVHPDRPSSERANWQSAAQDAGFATPTFRNSQYSADAGNQGDAFGLPYEVFSPDGDGYRDVLYIDYRLGTAGCAATITVYDAQGRRVHTLAQKTLLGSTGRFAWDGTRSDGHRAPAGIYVVYIEWFDLQGNCQRIRKSCALAMRR